MKTKEKFDILRGIPNVSKLSRSKINSIRLQEASLDRASSMLKLASSSVRHFTSPYIEQLGSVLKKSTSPVVLCSIPNYPLYCIYNISTHQSLLSIVPFRVEEVVRIPIRNLYSTCLYALVLRSAVQEMISTESVGLISSFFLSLFLKLFGRKYGLLASYASLVPDLKYILTVYTAVGLFGIPQTDKVYVKAATSSGLANYTKYDLEKFDFTTFRSVIASLDQLQIFPGFNEYEFVNRVNMTLNLQFLPMFEDLPRLLATVAACDIAGNSVFPNFIKSFNKSVFNSLVILASRVLMKHKLKLFR